MESLLRLWLVVFILTLAWSASGAERVALIIGNTDYPEGSIMPDIPMAERDARLIAETLKDLDFEVITVTNVTKGVMMNRLLDFKEKIEPGGAALFYFAGHGVEYQKKNYLIASNAMFRDRDLLGEEALEADTVVRMITGKNPKTAMVFLDCCREAPPNSWLQSYQRTRNASTLGLAKIEPGPGLVIGFAASAGNLANDHLGGDNGPYATALARYMKSGEELTRVLKLAGREVNTLSRQIKERLSGETGLVVQEPAVYGQIYHDFYFTRKKESVAAPDSAAQLAKMRAEVERLRKEKEAAEAAAKMVNAVASPQLLSGGHSAGSRGFTNTLGMKFVPVPGTDVLFSVYETRVKDYAAFASANSGVGSKWKDVSFEGHRQTSDHPVVNVSWEDAKVFCEWLSRKEGKTYRLPTDHEWSVAVGIGNREDATASPESKSVEIADVYPWGTAWPPPNGSGNLSGQESAASFKSKDYRDNHPFTAPVGSYEANQFGLHDLGGNVWEWCEDLYDADKGRRVLRGGSCFNSRVNLWSSYRESKFYSFSNDTTGFRCVVVVGSAR